jgi:hypothetical protein
MPNSPLLSMRVDQHDLDRLDEVRRRRSGGTGLAGSIASDAGRLRAAIAREALRIGLQTMLSNP